MAWQYKEDNIKVIRCYQILGIMILKYIIPSIKSHQIFRAWSAGAAGCRPGILTPAATERHRLCGIRLSQEGVLICLDTWYSWYSILIYILWISIRILDMFWYIYHSLHSWYDMNFHRDIPWFVFNASPQWWKRIVSLSHQSNNPHAKVQACRPLCIEEYQLASRMYVGCHCNGKATRLGLCFTFGHDSKSKPKDLKKMTTGVLVMFH